MNNLLFDYQDKLAVQLFLNGKF